MSIFSNFMGYIGNGKSSKYFEDTKLGQPRKLKSGYISSSTPLHSGYGDALYSNPSRKIVTKRNPKVGNTYGMTQGLYIYNDPKEAQRQQQQAYQRQLQATVNASAAANTKQLKILQGEKSAISKMTQDYTNMLAKEAEAKAKAMEDAKIAAATTAANQSRQGQTSNLQIQPASQTAKAGGTKVFKKRGLNQFLSGISGMVNI